MKNYSYSIDIDFSNNGGDFMQSLMAEVEDEKRQLALTRKINAATNELHKNILCDLIVELNKIFKPIGVEFGNVMPSITEINGYHEHMARCKMHNNQSVTLHISGAYGTNNTDSKYTTYGGKHVLRVLLEYNGILPTHCDARRKGSLVKNIDDILRHCRLPLKEVLANA